jgi:hypothetical protein
VWRCVQLRDSVRPCVPVLTPALYGGSVTFSKLTGWPAGQFWVESWSCGLVHGDGRVEFGHVD